MTASFTKDAVLEILRTPAASDTFTDMIRRVEALEGGGVRVLRGGNIVVVDGIGYPLHALVSAAFALVKETDNPGFNMPGWFYSGSPYAEQIKNLGVSPCGIPESFKPEYVPDLGAAWRKGPTSWEIYAKALEPVAEEKEVSK